MQKFFSASYSIIITTKIIFVNYLLDVIDNCPRKVFTFDRIFDTDSTNQEIYNDVVSPLVDSVLLGYNGCVFAYGQTSCGKTFSMQGKISTSVRNDN